MRILGLTGRAGSGKSTVVQILKRGYHVEEISLAGPLKEFCRQVFDFSEDQLYGPSETRNGPDHRYPRFDYPRFDLPAGPAYLTPRYALQTLGTEWGRDCYPEIWIDLGLRRAAQIAKTGALPVISDVRFLNEALRIREAGGEIWRVTREAEIDHKPDYSKHASESEQEEILQDQTIWNTRDLDGLKVHVWDMARAHGVPLKPQGELRGIQ